LEAKPCSATGPLCKLLKSASTTGARHDRPPPSFSHPPILSIPRRPWPAPSTQPTHPSRRAVFRVLRQHPGGAPTCAPTPACDALGAVAAALAGRLLARHFPSRGGALALLRLRPGWCTVNCGGCRVLTSLRAAARTYYLLAQWWGRPARGGDRHEPPRRLEVAEAIADFHRERFGLRKSRSWREPGDPGRAAPGAGSLRFLVVSTVGVNLCTTSCRAGPGAAPAQAPGGEFYFADGLRRSAAYPKSACPVTRVALRRMLSERPLLEATSRQAGRRAASTDPRLVSGTAGWRSRSRPERAHRPLRFFSAPNRLFAIDGLKKPAGRTTAGRDLQANRAHPHVLFPSNSPPHRGGGRVFSPSCGNTFRMLAKSATRPTSSSSAAFDRTTAPSRAAVAASFDLADGRLCLLPLTGSHFQKSASCLLSVHPSGFLRLFRAQSRSRS